MKELLKEWKNFILEARTSERARLQNAILNDMNNPPKRAYMTTDEGAWGALPYLFELYFSEEDEGYFHATSYLYKLSRRNKKRYNQYLEIIENLILQQIIRIDESPYSYIKDGEKYDISQERYTIYPDVLTVFGRYRPKLGFLKNGESALQGISGKIKPHELLYGYKEPYVGQWKFSPINKLTVNDLLEKL